MFSRNSLMIAMIFSIGFNTLVYGQIGELRFQVIDSESKNPIAYANVGVVEKPLGTNSNLQGEVIFKYRLRDIDASDIIAISCIGYYTRKLSIEQLQTTNSTIIELQPKTSVLEEVTIHSNRLKRQVLGKNSKGALTHINIYSVKDSIDDGLSQEFGIILKNRRNCMINSFSFFLSSNNFEYIKFRFNLYKYNKETGVGDYVVTDQIYFEVINSRVGWIRVNLEPYNVEFDEGDIVATAQIVETSFSKNKPRLALPVVAPSPFNGFLYRDKSQNKWSINNSANPSIYIEAACD